jgi:hypothetical protein
MTEKEGAAAYLKEAVGPVFAPLLKDLVLERPADVLGHMMLNLQFAIAQKSSDGEGIELAYWGGRGLMEVPRQAAACHQWQVSW